jgi:SAM-dependent methyltransferase
MPLAPVSIDDVLSLKHRWYHAIEMAPGVVTPGFVDLRGHDVKAGLPPDMSGLKAIDVGMFDGFWSFSMERRGAQVDGIDIDEVPPPGVPRIHHDRVREEAIRDDVVTGRGFEALKQYFGSSVERNVGTVMTLSAARIGGAADFAFVGAFLLHMRDPIGALERVYDALKPGGRLTCYEPIIKPSRKDAKQGPMAKLLALGNPWTYWYPNRECLEHWVRTAGFVDVTTGDISSATDVTNNTQYLLPVHARKPGC